MCSGHFWRNRGYKRTANKGKQYFLIYIFNVFNVLDGVSENVAKIQFSDYFLRIVFYEQMEFKKMFYLKNGFYGLPNRTTKDHFLTEITEPQNRTLFFWRTQPPTPFTFFKCLEAGIRTSVKTFRVRDSVLVIIKKEFGFFCYIIKNGKDSGFFSDYL